MNKILITSILCLGLLLSSIAPAQVETITADELKNLKREMDKLKEAAGDAKAVQADTGAANKQQIAVGRTIRDKLNDGSLGPEMIMIPAGEFRMGSTAEDIAQLARDGYRKDYIEHERPQRTVRLAKALAVGKYEVTRGQFAQFVRATGHHFINPSCFVYDPAEKDIIKSKTHDWQSPGFVQNDNHPVVCLNWEDAQAYARWLSEQTGQRYRLLSEAEWEYAARAGSQTRYYWGNDAGQACRYANVGDQAVDRQYPGWKWGTHDCDDKVEQTAKVGRYVPNAWGLYDMIGNVWEWTADCWNASYAGNPPTNGTAWIRGDCESRVLRGGSWENSPEMTRVASRNKEGMFIPSQIVGFRLARELVQ